MQVDIKLQKLMCWTYLEYLNEYAMPQNLSAYIKFAKQ